MPQVAKRQVSTGTPQCNEASACIDPLAINFPSENASRGLGELNSDGSQQQRLNKLQDRCKTGRPHQTRFGRTITTFAHRLSDYRPQLHDMLQITQITAIRALLLSHRDVKLLFVQQFFQQFAISTAAFCLVTFLSEVGFDDGWIGLFMSLTIAGNVIIGAVLAVITDRVGRRLILRLGAAFMLISGLVFTFSTNYCLLLVAAVFGVVSPR